MMEPIFAIVLHGFDYEPQILAVGSLEWCRENIDEASEDTGAIFPWNGTSIIQLKLNEKIDWENQEKVSRKDD